MPFRRRTIGLKIAIAGAAIAIAGAVSGAAIGDTSVKYRQLEHDSVPQASIQREVADRGANEAPLPNHYAIETPEGRFEVEELRSRGLYSNARFGRTYYRNAPYGDAVADLDAEQPDLAVAARHAAADAAAVGEVRAPGIAVIETTAAERATTAPKPPLFDRPGERAASSAALAPAPAPAPTRVPASGRAKIIDVSTELGDRAQPTAASPVAPATRPPVQP